VAMARAPIVALMASTQRGLLAATAWRDEELVARALRGEVLAEEVLFRRHAPSLLAVALRLLGRRSEAEDAVQDTFVLALERLDQLRDPSALRAWLRCIVVSQARRRLRRARMLRSLGIARAPGDDEVSLESLASNDASPDTHAQLAQIDRVLRRLPVDERLAWTLRRVEGWQLADVASACDCSLATAKRRIAVADRAVGATSVISPEESP